MTFHKKRTNKRHLHPKRHASHSRKMSRSRKGGFGDEESPDDDIEKGSLAEEQANMDADNMKLGGLPKEEEPVQEPMEEKEPPGPWWVGGKSNKSRRHSKKRKAHKTHKRRHARKHSKSHKKK